MMDERELEKGTAFLAEAGLNLFAILDPAALPEQSKKAMLAAGVPLEEYARLVLIGHGGRRMWEALQEWGMETADPVDYYSTTITRQFIDEFLHDPAVLWLYPDSPYLIPLQQLGQLAGWSTPSPLGQGINPTYGVWFAYRTAFLTTLKLPVHRSDSTTPPEPTKDSPPATRYSPLNLCEGCLGKPCIKACPVGAVRLEQFDVEECVEHRLAANSPCADRCLARMACPFFPEHRYSLAQIQYHYDRSFMNLRAWYDNR